MTVQERIYSLLFARLFPICLLVSFTIACGSVAAQEKPGTAQCPANLTECIKELKATLPSGTLDKFRSSPETITDDYDLSLGLWICNNWIMGQWHHQSPLAKYFMALGIENAEDMSGIVLHSLWRDLHSQPIQLEEQVTLYKRLALYNLPQITEERSIPENIWNQALRTYSGQLIRLAEFKGKPLILLFFADDTFTESAIASLNSISKMYGANTLKIVGIMPPPYSLDSKKKSDFMRKSQPSFPIVFDSTPEFEYAVQDALTSPSGMNMPETILIGKNGKMITRFHGWDKTDTPPALEKSVRATLGK